MSRSELAPDNWPYNSASNCRLVVKLRTSSSLPWFFTSLSNAAQGTSFNMSRNTVFVCGTALILFMSRPRAGYPRLFDAQDVDGRDIGERKRCRPLDGYARP